MELNKIYNEDCLGDKESGTGMWRIPDKSVDMVLCDLPYGTTKNHWDTVIPFEPLWEHYERVIKDNGAIVLTAQTPFDKVLGVSNLKLLRYEWIWEKSFGSGHLNAKKMPLKKHENILVFYKKLPTYNPQMKKGNPYAAQSSLDSSTNYGKQTQKITVSEDGMRYPLSIIYFNSKGKGIIGHPTEKPVKLFEYLIKTYTNKGETVLDNCMGSGTTAEACINTGRNYIGFETDVKWYEKATERTKKAYRKPKSLF